MIPKTYAIKINNPIDDKTIFLFFEAIGSLIDKITMSHIGKKTKNAPIASTHNVFTQSPISPNSLTVNTSITNINNKILCIVFIIPSFFNKKNTLKNVMFSRVFRGFNQQNGVFASTKQKAQNGRNNSWTQYQKPYVFITTQFDIFIVFFYFFQPIHRKMYNVKRLHIVSFCTDKDCCI